MFNNYRKKLVKITASLMAVILIIGLFPAKKVFGFIQPGVTKLEIEDGNSSINSADSYAVNLKWSLWSSHEVQPGVEDDELNPAKTGIIVKSERLAGVKDVKSYMPILPYNATQAEIELDGAVRGSLYSIKIDPFHQHKTVIMENGIEKPGPSVNVYPPSGTGEEVLYMTNIKVDAKGFVNENGENSLTVTWDNPTYNGTKVIPNYKIYFTPVTTDAIKTIGDFKIRPIDVIMTEVNNVVDPLDTTIQRMEYTFSHNSLEQGNSYVIAVEPCDATGTPFREQPPKRTVSVNGKRTQIEFKKNVLYASPEVGIPFTLNLDIYSDAYLRLSWPKITVGGATVILIESSTNDKDWSEITRIYDTDRTDYLVPRPKGGTTSYRVSYYRGDMDIKDGEKALKETSLPNPSFTAAGIDITPSRPELTLDSKSIPADKNIIIDATWGAYIRAPFTDAEKEASTGSDTDGRKYVDTEVYYDIWLTDDFNAVVDLSDYIPKIVEQGSFALKKPENIYTTSFAEYYDTTTQKMEKIVPNKLYYAKIVARRPSGTPLDGVMERKSEPGYATFYITAQGEIATPPMISKPPLQVAKNADGEELITQTSITFTWRTKWIELYDNEKTKQWHTVVGKSGSKIVYGEEAKAANVTPIDLGIYKDLDGLHSDLKNVIAREMDLTGSKYEYKQYPYNEISGKIGSLVDYEAFLKDVTEKEPAGTWTQIEPVALDENGYPIFTITGTENTTYVVLFRAYRDVPPTGLKVAFPTYIVEATLPIDVDVIIKPTVPKLELIEGSVTDISAKVKWESTKLLKYELAFSDMYNEPEKGIQITIPEVDDKGEIKTENDIDFTHLPIDGLFPDTLYKVWIRAVTLDGSQKSSWSNYLTFETDEMPVPSPPRGLGPASAYDLEMVNASSTSTKYSRITKDSFIITWLKNDKDKADNKTGADPESDSNTSRIEDDSLTDIFLAQFNKLLPNKEHYVRAKTIATVTPIDNGRADKTYSYEVQVSVTPDFEDYYSIIVPETIKNPDADGSTRYYKQKESDWTTTIRVKTGTTSDEYDGAADAAFYPLQNGDYEEIYDYTTNSVTFRFRVDGTDSAGNHDNRVDQRFISQLAASKIYTYNLDLSQNSFTTKTVEMPYSIIKALDERKIDLKIKPTNTTVVTIPYGAIAGAAVKGMQGLSDTTKVAITVSNNVSAPVVNSSENYIVYPYKIGVKAVSAKQTINMTDTLKPMTLEMKSPRVEGTYDKNTGVYATSSVNDSWQRINATYDTKNSEFETSATKLGLYSVIAANTPDVRGTNAAEIDATYNMSSKLTLTDSPVIDTSGSVTGNIYNNILLSVLENKSSVDINSDVSQSDLKKLAKAGMGVSAEADSEVIREEAIAALVTLYEKKTGSRIKYYNNLDESPYVDIADASPSYQQSILKAAEIGFFTDESFTRPNSSLTYGELMYMVNIINENSK